MKPDARNRISDLYHAALQRPAEQRRAFLQEACDGDEGLREEVESLLRHESSSVGFLERPAVEAVAERFESESAGFLERPAAGVITPGAAPDSRAMIGRQLGPYTILSPLGAGGMGEVYRARDRKLGRDVAIKILPSHFTTDPERRSRFAREARLLATLNHPHIGAIYGLEEADAVTALVLELVEGPTLADRLERGPLAVADALAIARQVAEALDAAHDKGIIHRDLKPANIVLQGSGGPTSSGFRAKVLDFGLAKTMAVGPDGDLTRHPPGSLDGTAAGRILGTPAYMSPEQARGQAVDKRTDIWAFGCVLYEMLAGRRAFEGDTVTDTLVRVLEREPDWTALPAATPEPVRKLLRRCLQKDPGRRVRDIGDARQELDEGPDAFPPMRAPRGRRWWALGLAALLIVTVALGVSSGRLLTRPDPSLVLRPQRLTSLVGLEEAPALSPDGRSVAFTAGVNGRRQVFVQDRAGGGEPNQITFDDADHQFPRWTPDSSSLLYFSPASPGDRQGTLYQIATLRGQARTVASSMGAGDVRSSDSRLTYFRLVERKIELVTAPLDVSSVTVLARFDPTSGFYMYPRWSPDGQRIAYQFGNNLEQNIFIVPAVGEEPGQLPEQLTVGAINLNGFAWLPDSSGILYSSSRDDTMLYLPTARLWHVALADRTTRPVTSGEASYTNPDIGRSGTVLATRLDLRSDIWKYPIDGSPHVNMQTAVRVTHQTSHVLTPTAGPGYQELAFLSDRGGHANLWVINVGTGRLRQITNERDPKVTVGVPVWSPAGDSIAFVSSRPPSDAPSGQELEQSRPPLGIWLVNRDGSNLRNIVKVGVGPSWSPDGRWIYYTPRIPGGLFKIGTEGGTPQTVRTDKLRNLIGADGTTAYMVFERPLVDGLPVFEIHAASPENGPSHVLARVSPSRVPTWQILNPSLSPDGKWIAMALADGFSTNIWTLSTSTRAWRQITDFGGRPTFIARRVSWSSDGRSVLAAVGEGDADIVLLDGLLSTGRN